MNTPESRVANILRRFKEGDSIGQIYGSLNLPWDHVEDILRAYMLGVDAGKNKESE